MSETSYESSLELIEDSDDEQSEDIGSENSDEYHESSDDDEVGTVSPSTVNWRTPISGITVSTTNQAYTPQTYTPQAYTPQTYTPQPQAYTPQTYTPQPQAYTPQAYTPQAYTPQPQAYTPQPQAYTPQPQAYTPQPQAYTPQLQNNFMIEIIQPEVQSQVRFEKKGRNFLVQTPPGYLNQYKPYLESLRGTYEEFLQGQIGSSYLIGQWTFRSNQEEEVKSVISQILSGQLLPPEQLKPSNQINIDMSTLTITPSQWSQPQSTQIISSNAMASVPNTTSTKGRGRGKGKTEPVQEFILPSQVIASTITSQSIPITAPSVMNQGDKETYLPTYDPMNKEPGESQSEYDVRKYLYQYCITNYQMKPDDADKLSRMRNNVDIQGIGYNQSPMNVLNSYLPR